MAGKEKAPQAAHSVSSSENYSEEHTSSTTGNRCEDEKQCDAPIEQDSSFSNKRWKEVLVACIPIALICFLVWLDETVLATAIPRISDEFHSSDQIGWYGPSYLFGLCASQLALGRLYKDFPSRITYLACLLVFEAASLVQAAAPSSAAFIAGRTLAGIAGSGVLVGSLTIFSEEIPKAKLPYVMGTFSWIHSLGTVTGPVIGGAITSSSLTWRWCFYLNPIVAAVALGPVLFLWRGKLFQPPKAGKRSPKEVLTTFDYTGMVLFAAASVASLLGLQFGGSSYSWSDGRTITCLVVGGLLFLGFAAAEWWAGSKAMIPITIIRKRAVSISLIYTSLLDGAYFILTYQLPLWFQAVLDLSARDSGYRILPLLLSCIAGTMTGTTLTGKFHYVQPLMLVGAILLAVGSGVLTIVNPGISPAVWIVGEILSGVGTGLGTSLPLLTVQDVLQPPDVPIGYAAVLTAGYLGSSIALALSQAIFASRLEKDIQEQLPGMNPYTVVDSGATDWKGLVPTAFYERALQMYNTALTQSWYLAVVLAGLSAFVVLGYKWKKLDMRDRK